jgi:CubicO group peptidase (beta-lactamase class C family)
MKKLIAYSFAFSLFSFSFSASAQVIDKTNKVSPSVDYTKLAYIDTVVNNYLKNNWETGLVTIIVKDNQLVQYKGYGYLDAATKKPMPADAMFRIMLAS